MNDEHVPHPCMHATQRCTWNSSSESRTLASHHEETLGKHHLTAIGVRGRDSYYQLIRASHTRKSEFALEFEPPPRAIQIRYYWTCLKRLRRRFFG